MTGNTLRDKIDSRQTQTNQSRVTKKKIQI